VIAPKNVRGIRQAETAESEKDLRWDDLNPARLPVLQNSLVSSPSDQRWRIALYSHDTMGLGHMRRNLLIAKTLTSSPFDVEILVVAGTVEAASFAKTMGMKCVTIPSLHKDQNGEYSSRKIRLPLKDLVAIRSQAILSAIRKFGPHVLIVDKVPRGALHELDSTLHYLRSNTFCQCVLGLREVLDEREKVQHEWKKDDNENTIARYYHSIWVYGDPSVFDTIREYGFSDFVASKAVYTGYHDQRLRLDHQKATKRKFKEILGSNKRLILCLLGGGQDGTPLAQTFCAIHFPAGSVGVLISGPFLPQDVREKLEFQARNNPRLHILGFVLEPAPFLDRADRIISMGGYNTICEVLSFEKPALIVPRVKPRKEQWIRAKRLQDLGFIDVLHPDDLKPESLRRWLISDVAQPKIRDRIDLDGLKRLPNLLGQILTSHVEQYNKNRAVNDD
jgi:predicted glycosyltransferase